MGLRVCVECVRVSGKDEAGGLSAGAGVSRDPMVPMDYSAQRTHARIESTRFRARRKTHQGDRRIARRLVVARSGTFLRDTRKATIGGLNGHRY
jgi:hypothetical protein